jgi:alpha-galactosidase
MIKVYLTLGLILSSLNISMAASEAADLEQRLRLAPAAVLLDNGNPADAASVRLERVWAGSVCRARLQNIGARPLRVGRIDLFDLSHKLAGSTRVYGESFQMLAQVGGTMEKPEDWGSYPDRTHYKLDEPDGLRTAHGMLLLHLADDAHVLFGFTSCRRFDGRISFDTRRLLISLDGENRELAPGATWELEDFLVQNGADREALLDALCAEIQKNHPRRAGFEAPALGWCSWYCFGPTVTAGDIAQNLDWIATHAPQLRYIQIDDGYQPWMGDWLETGKSFGGNIESVLREIRRRGFEPAIWVAPFIASPQSKLFHEHPDWFMKGDDGQPLRSDKVGFGGWRLGPWYALDGTHPEAQEFLEHLFRTLREQWGCTYFKLDASYWGALHHAHLHDPNATRIEAYRRGMAAILRGAGNALVLGCNQPMWPSLGLVDAARTSMDISRSWKSIRAIGRQNLLRAWQNGRLWWNDPDCVLLAGRFDPEKADSSPGREVLLDGEISFHATALHAVGGMVLSGDDLPALSPQRVGILKKLLPPAGHAARFVNEEFTVGRSTNNGREFIYLFNWDDQPAERRVDLTRRVKLQDFWTGQDLGEQLGEFRLSLPPRTARLLEAEPISNKSAPRSP